MIKNAKKNLLFILENIQKYLKCPALNLFLTFSAASSSLLSPGLEAVSSTRLLLVLSSVLSSGRPLLGSGGLDGPEVGVDPAAAEAE